MMESRVDFLFTVWHGGGNIPPIALVTRQLIRAGHSVRVLGENCDRHTIEDSGAQFISWTRAPNRTTEAEAADVLADWKSTSLLEGSVRLRDRVMFGPALAYAMDTRSEIERLRPDLIVSNPLLFGPMAAAESTSVPLALLTTSVWPFPTIDGRPPMGQGLLPPRTPEERVAQAAATDWLRRFLDSGILSLNNTRAALALPPIGNVLKQIDVASRVLLGTSSVFEFEPDAFGARYRFVGPQIEPQSVSDIRQLTGFNTTRQAPIVLVAFSTTYQNQRTVVQRVFDAVGALAVHGVATAGALDRSTLQPPANLMLFDKMPHDALMAHTDLVVTHAGHGTVLRALSHGVPLLCLPMGRDQHDNAARVVHLGAGSQLPADASSAALKTMIEKLLLDATVRDAARRAGETIRREIARYSIVRELEEVVHQARRHNGGQKEFSGSLP